MVWLQPSSSEAQWVEDIHFNLLVSRFIAGVETVSFETSIMEQCRGVDKGRVDGETGL